MDILVHRREPLNLDRPSDLRPQRSALVIAAIAHQVSALRGFKLRVDAMLADQHLGGTPNADFGYHALSTPEITTVAPGLRPMISQVKLAQ
jgi:hypothetical protein